MDIDQKYTFVSLPADENSIGSLGSLGSLDGINDNKLKDFFKKWGLNFSIQEYLFNEPFHRYHKYQFAEAFFKDENVANTLKIYQDGGWVPRGIAASSVVVEQVPCSVLNMSFFDKLRNPKNNIAHNSGRICKRWDTEIDGFAVSDNLRGMLLDERSPEYHLYPDVERRQFIFRLLRTLVLGGELCQYEDELEPYLSCAKSFYKHLVRVEKASDSEDLSVSTMVLKIIAKDANRVSYFPHNFHNLRNNGFLLIDGEARVVRTLLHQSSGYFA